MHVLLVAWASLQFQDTRQAMERYGAGDPAREWVAARFLDRTERDWKLRYDRLTTREGSFSGRAEGGIFHALSGKRLESTGKLERDVADPAAAAVRAFLAAGDDGSALQELARGLETQTEATDALRHLAQAPLSALGEKAGAAAGRLGFLWAEGRWGTPDQIRHFRCVTSGAEGAATFTSRYACAIARIRKAFENGAGFESAHRAILAAAELGGPRASGHLKALGDGFKSAVYCKACKNGKVPCAGCGGKGKRDIDCAPCGGQGRVRPSGALGSTDLLVKCRNCDGLKVFKGVGCADCAKTGQAPCAACLGRPWRDRPCANPACKDGAIPCGTCKGAGLPKVDCPTCQGKGRTQAQGAVNGADVSAKCRGCDGKKTVDAHCASCDRRGRVACPDCAGKQGAPRTGLGGLADVFSSDPCRDCAGAGWPLPQVAAACPKCFGLGIRVKPASDPSKMLE